MVIADKYRYYLRKVRQRKLELGQNVEKVVYLTKADMEKAVEGQILDEIGVMHPCCRRHFLGHTDIIDLL